MAEERTMNLDKLAEIANISLDSAISTRSKYTYREVFLALLAGENIADASKILGTTDTTLEHILSRNIKKLFPRKIKATKWNNFLYGLLQYKKCTGCSLILPLDNYSKNNETPDGYAYYCKDCRAITRKHFSDTNPEYAKTNYLINKSEYIARAIKYNTRRDLATPPWANLEIISRIYDCAEGDHVDHIIPLQGKYVCGLHVENNLQYLSVEENLRKSNKFITDWE